MAVDFRSILSPQAMCLGVSAQSADEVIALLGERLIAMGKVKANYTAALIERERTMPTGLPLGAINVAVPHSDPVHVIAPAIALATLTEPVSFGSMDDPDEKLPVQIVVALALNDKDAQIEMLQAVAGFIQNPGALSALLSARTPEEAFAAFPS
ncbi:PTS sugar transporter subunit IIA [Microvirga guangxiensis]|uniref:PTS system, galactitol-specific IIA component n=1 Tax=Microvirga guangxiensis TaxID=549386 RepID=A0A1G5E5W2_9HYPH|nr:PTS sugar transporter subunit IIA [Microvirga guangxiensis]SCY22131.1 PTS system, galactitol-specific IIA component [Microvirga guangxiensis]